jgi:hypothetical protein
LTSHPRPRRRDPTIGAGGSVLLVTHFSVACFLLHEFKLGSILQTKMQSVMLILFDDLRPECARRSEPEHRSQCCLGAPTSHTIRTHEHCTFGRSHDAAASSPRRRADFKRLSSSQPQPSTSKPLRSLLPITFGLMCSIPDNVNDMFYGVSQDRLFWLLACEHAQLGRVCSCQREIFARLRPVAGVRTLSCLALHQSNARRPRNDLLGLLLANHRAASAHPVFYLQGCGLRHGCLRQDLLARGSRPRSGLLRSRRVDEPSNGAHPVECSQPRG